MENALPSETRQLKSLFHLEADVSMTFKLKSVFKKTHSEVVDLSYPFSLFVEYLTDDGIDCLDCIAVAIQHKSFIFLGIQETTESQNAEGLLFGADEGKPLNVAESEDFKLHCFSPPFASFAAFSVFTMNSKPNSVYVVENGIRWIEPSKKHIIFDSHHVNGSPKLLAKTCNRISGVLQLNRHLIALIEDDGSVCCVTALDGISIPTKPPLPDGKSKSATIRSWTLQSRLRMESPSIRRNGPLVSCKYKNEIVVGGIGVSDDDRSAYLILEIYNWELMINVVMFKVRLSMTGSSDISSLPLSPTTVENWNPTNDASNPVLFECWIDSEENHSSLIERLFPKMISAVNERIVVGFADGHILYLQRSKCKLLIPTYLLSPLCIERLRMAAQCRLTHPSESDPLPSSEYRSFILRFNPHPVETCHLISSTRLMLSFVSGRTAIQFFIIEPGYPICLCTSPTIKSEVPIVSIKPIIGNSCTMFAVAFQDLTVKLISLKERKSNELCQASYDFILNLSHSQLKDFWSNYGCSPNSSKMEFSSIFHIDDPDFVISEALEFDSFDFSRVQQLWQHLLRFRPLVKNANDKLKIDQGNSLLPIYDMLAKRMPDNFISWQAVLNRDMTQIKNLCIQSMCKTTGNFQQGILQLISFEDFWNGSSVWNDTDRANLILFLLETIPPLFPTEDLILFLKVAVECTDFIERIEEMSKAIVLFLLRLSKWLDCDSLLLVIGQLESVSIVQGEVEYIVYIIQQYKRIGALNSCSLYELLGFSDLLRAHYFFSSLCKEYLKEDGDTRKSSRKYEIDSQAFQLLFKNGWAPLDLEYEDAPNYGSDDLKHFLDSLQDKDDIILTTEEMLIIVKQNVAWSPRFAIETKVVLAYFDLMLESWGGPSYSKVIDQYLVMLGDASQNEGGKEHPSIFHSVLMTFRQTSNSFYFTNNNNNNATMKFSLDYLPLALHLEVARLVPSKVLRGSMLHRILTKLHQTPLKLAHSYYSHFPVVVTIVVDECLESKVMSSIQHCHDAVDSNLRMFAGLKLSDVVKANQNVEKTKDLCRKIIFNSTAPDELFQVFSLIFDDWFGSTLTWENVVIQVFIEKSDVWKSVNVWTTLMDFCSKYNSTSLTLLEEFTQSEFRALSTFELEKLTILTVLSRDSINQHRIISSSLQFGKIINEQPKLKNCGFKPADLTSPCNSIIKILDVCPELSLPTNISHSKLKSIISTLLQTNEEHIRVLLAILLSTIKLGYVDEAHQQFRSLLTTYDNMTRETDTLVNQTAALLLQCFAQTFNHTISNHLIMDKCSQVVLSTANVQANPGTLTNILVNYGMTTTAKKIKSTTLKSVLSPSWSSCDFDDDENQRETYWRNIKEGITTDVPSTMVFKAVGKVLSWFESQQKEAKLIDSIPAFQELRHKQQPLGVLNTRDHSSSELDYNDSFLNDATKPFVPENKPENEELDDDNGENNGWEETDVLLDDDDIFLSRGGKEGDSGSDGWKDSEDDFT